MDRPIDDAEAEHPGLVARSPVATVRGQLKRRGESDVAVELGEAMEQLANRWKLRAQMWKDHDHIAVTATDVGEALERCARELLGEGPP